MESKCVDKSVPSTIRSTAYPQFGLLAANYPKNLITKDRWGATPLLYAFWGDAPTEIIQFLLNRYQSLYPDHEFDWTDMVITLN